MVWLSPKRALSDTTPYRNMAQAQSAAPKQHQPTHFALPGSSKVMNDVVFPTRLDFGVHALGETIRRTVKMVCKVGEAVSVGTMDLNNVYLVVRYPCSKQR